ncbi:MAG TPA: radical SAM protein, partial [Gemmataceae bacterium]|nr:radical SAM protein [Gemmataceae bacterium]
EANFTEVEIGLQSIDPEAQEKMDRKNNLRAFERGVRAIMDEGIHVKVDLIVGLPGDTVESVRRGMKYLRSEKLYSDMQVFNLSILPGTAFRLEAEQLGLRFQPRPPYYVLSTPTLRTEELYQLMDEAREIFELEFDAQPPPILEFEPADRQRRVCLVDLDEPFDALCPEDHHQAFTLWLRSAQFRQTRGRIVQLVRQILAANPFTTLQIVLEPKDATLAEKLPNSLTLSLLQEILAACQEPSTYLDRYYSMQPGRSNGAKRLILLLPADSRPAVAESWREAAGDYATLVWRSAQGDCVEEIELDAHEYA